MEKNFKKEINIIIRNQILHNKKNNYISLINMLIKNSNLEPETIYNSILQNIEYIKSVVNEMEGSDYYKINSIINIAIKKFYTITYAGCYEIKNNSTNEIYIGESINIFDRFKEHISELYENKHHCKALQDSFNESKSISNFTITPLFIFPIFQFDKNEIKHETLYLETAFYIMARNKKKTLYNTMNTYVALKENLVSVKGYDIDCKKVLNMLVEDKYKILSNEVLTVIKDDLKNNNLIDLENKNDKDIKTKVNIKTNKNNQNYRINNILKEFAEKNILPIDYDYNKVRQVMVENNLITVDYHNRTVATDYSIENELYFVSGKTTKDGYTKFNYYLSEKCKQLLFDIFSNYENIESLRKTTDASTDI